MKESYLGFTFAGRHSSEFNLLVVSDGSRYHQPLFNNFSDNLLSVPGKSGSYYFGTNIGTREFIFNVAYDNLSTFLRNEMQKWLYPNRIGWLVFDETPYKKYLVKISEVPQLDFVPFGSRKEKNNFTYTSDILKGTTSIGFVCLEEFAILNENFKYEEENSFSITSTKIKNWKIESGILPASYTHTNIFFPNETAEIIADTQFHIYNAGNGISYATFHFFVAPFSTGILSILNMDAGEELQISSLDNLFIMSDGHNIEEISQWEIYIEGNKKEAWAYGVNSEGVRITEKTNIGSAFNHYYPKIVSVKPTEIVIIGQTVHQEGEDTFAEPIIFPFLYNPEDLFPSTCYPENEKLFQGFLQTHSDYIICTKHYARQVNSLINPAQLFIEMKEDFPIALPNGTVSYFICPNRFISNKDLGSFTPIYTYTYI